MIYRIFCITFVAAVQCQLHNESFPTLTEIQSGILSVFGTTEKSSTKPAESCFTDGTPGECVPYYFCANGTVITGNLLDIRLGDCADSFEECCRTENVVKTERPQPLSGAKKCGARNVNGVGVRITGQTDGESEIGEFPWMAAILKQESIGEGVYNVYMCGGSLIHPSVVLTASHCVKNKDPLTFKIRLGEWDTKTTNEAFPHVQHDVEGFVIHEDYFSGPLYNDIALLFLTTPVKIERHINTICLPQQDQKFDHSRCFVSGWGKNKFGKEGIYQEILKKVEVPIVPTEACEDALRVTRLGKRFTLHESFICAGGEAGIDSCKGDGGSPLVCPVAGNPGQYLQVGIVAWGIGCGEADIPAVYANVAKFRNWIDQAVGQRDIDLRSFIH